MCHLLGQVARAHHDATSHRGLTKGSVMASAIDSADMCAVTRPASRRFYVHVDSLGFLVAAQPTFFGEIAHALALSGASRALDQVMEDWSMFSPSGTDVALSKGASNLHDLAAEALQTAFQCIVQLVPPRYGATELLLGSYEKKIGRASCRERV